MSTDKTNQVPANHPSYVGATPGFIPVNQPYYVGATPGFIPTGYEQPPPYFAQQNNAVVFTAAQPVTHHNVVIYQTVFRNGQIPDVLPGFAFCKFTPGIIETVLRVTLLIMLLVLILMAGVTINEEKKVVTDGGIIIDATGWQGAAGWIIFVASLTLITEAVMILLHFVNPSCFNNRYGIFGGLDITKCVMAGVGLLIGCIITGVETAVANDDLDDGCDEYFSNPDNNDACNHLQTIYRLVIVLTVLNAVCLVLLLFLFVWDIIFLSAGFNYKVPVPRHSAQQRSMQQQ